MSKYNTPFEHQIVLHIAGYLQERYPGIDFFTGNHRYCSIDIYDERLRNSEKGMNLCEISIEGSAVVMFEMVDFGRSRNCTHLDLNDPNMFDKMCRSLDQLLSR